MRDFFGYCFTWACCPLPDATCCDDKEHCCPADLPVCDVDAGRCTAGPGAGAGLGHASVPWVAKVPATRHDSGRPWKAMARAAGVVRAALAGRQPAAVADA